MILQTDDRSWLPTSPREQAFLFSLSLSLMLNTTVVLLLLAGELPVLADLMDDDSPKRAERDIPTSPVQAVDATPDLVPTDLAGETRTSPPATPSQKSTQGPTAPTSVARIVTATATNDPAPPAEQTQPQQDDPPITFFGVGLE